jgi:predicted ArsR family transcriptional regulator
MRPPASSGPRQKLLFHLKTKGPQPADRLAERLGVTPMAIRQHMARLEEDGLVCSSDEAGRVGRPRRIWRLTPAAAEHFPDSHAELTLDILDAVRETFGDKGITKLVASRTTAQRALYKERMPPASAPLDKKVSALAALRRAEGYMAEWSREADGSLRLIENHCPICAAAEVCTGLCDGELALFESVLGPKVTVERTEYLLDGDRRCTYAIRGR